MDAEELLKKARMVHRVDPSALNTPSSTSTPDPTVQAVDAETVAATAQQASEEAAMVAEHVQRASEPDEAKRPVSNTEYSFWHLHQCLDAVNRLVPPDSPNGIAITEFKKDLVDMRNLLVDYDEAIQGLF